MSDPEKFMITPEDVEQLAVADGVFKKDLEVPHNVVLTFNKGIVDELKRVCDLTEWEWKGARYNQYYQPPSRSWKGRINSVELSVLVPAMGASPIAALAEDLIYFGADRIFLLCASWSLGEEYLGKGQIHLPSFTMGMDGTSIHYVNEEGYIKADNETFEQLKRALEDLEADWKEGGVGCCEAFYRIDEDMVDRYREDGCLSMDNGEVAALYSIANEYDITVGVLLQPYLDLEKGLEKEYMGEEYMNTCKIQARAVIGIIK